MSTKPAEDAWDVAQGYIKGYGAADTTGVNLQVMNDANRRFHLAANWPWSIGAIDEVTLANGTQDYALEVGASSPTDFLRLVQVRKFENNNTSSPLELAGALPATTVATGPLAQVGSFDDSGTMKYRLWPKITGMTSGSEAVLIGDYKKTVTAITSGNQGTADILPFDDEYYYIYQLWVNYYALLFANDQRSGSAQVDTRGHIIYSGMLGAAMEATTSLMATEVLILNPDGVQV